MIPSNISKLKLINKLVKQARILYDQMEDYTNEEILSSNECFNNLGFSLDNSLENLESLLKDDEEINIFS